MASSNVGFSYKQHPIQEDWDAIVIGSGIGGLATAALLARYGRKRVLVLERHYVVGGSTHAFHRPGYEWDVGVHYIGQVQDAASPLRASFDHLTGGRLEWSPMPDVYDRARIADRDYEFVSGRERFRECLKSYFPGEAGAIDRYLEAVRSVGRASGAYFASKALPRPVARLAGPVLRAPFLRWARRTTADALADVTTNPELKAILAAQWGDYGLPPAQSSFAVHAMIADHYFDGASFPWEEQQASRALLLPPLNPSAARLSSAPRCATSCSTAPRARRACGCRTAANFALPR